MEPAPGPAKPEPGVDVNRYAYALNDPINGIDPTGHSRGDWDPHVGTTFTGTGADDDGDGLGVTVVIFGDGPVGNHISEAIQNYINQNTERIVG